MIDRDTCFLFSFLWNKQNSVCHYYFFGVGTLDLIWLRSSYTANPWENNLHKLEFRLCLVQASTLNEGSLHLSYELEYLIMRHIIISEYVVCFKTLLCALRLFPLTFIVIKNVRQMLVLEHIYRLGGNVFSMKCHHSGVSTLRFPGEQVFLLNLQGGFSVY